MVDQTSEPGSVGVGQQTPGDGNSDFTALAFIIRQKLALLDVMKLVKVEAVHGGGAAAKPATVDVLPLVSQVDGAGNATPHGTVYGIPVLRLQGGTGAIVLEPKVGDVGFVVCADRDISAVKAAETPDKTVTPGSFRKMSIADGVYVGGCLNKAPEQFIAFTDDDVRWVDRHGNSIVTSAAGFKVADHHGNVLESTASGFTLKIGETTVMQATSSGVEITGTLRASQDVTAGAVSVQHHIHGAVQVGGGTSGPPVGG